MAHMKCGGAILVMEFNANDQNVCVASVCVLTNLLLNPCHEGSKKKRIKKEKRKALSAALLGWIRADVPRLVTRPMRWLWVEIARRRAAPAMRVVTR